MKPSLLKERVEAFSKRTDQFMRGPSGFTPDVDLSPLAIFSCGTCVACCIAPAIKSEEYQTGRLPPTPSKPAGTMCRYCDGKSCGVYDSRPTVCKGYLCLYRFGLTDARPDSTGVAWTVEIDQETMKDWCVIGHCQDVDAALDSPVLLTEAMQLLTIRVFRLKVNFVVLRDAKQVTVLKRAPDGHYMCVTADIIQDGMFIHADECSMRPRPLKREVFAKALENLQDLANQ